MDDITLKNYLKNEYRKYPKSIIKDNFPVSYSSSTTRSESSLGSRNSNKKSVRFNPLVDVVNIESNIYDETGRKLKIHRKIKKIGYKKNSEKKFECESICEIF